MYDMAKRKQLFDITVGELIEELNKLPLDAKVSCCGDANIWLHVEEDGSGVCIDAEDLDDCYFDDLWEDGD